MPETAAARVRQQAPAPVRLALPSIDELALSAQGGSRGAFAELVERYHGPLYHFLCMRLARRADAEELTQEVFLRAWQKLDHYDPRWRFSTWLYTLAKRLAVSHGRKRRRERELDGGPDALEELAAERERDPVDLASIKEEGAEIWDLAQELLSVEQRSALWLRYAEDLPPEEIARILKKRGVTVRVLLFRARERLARHLAQRADRRAVRTPLCPAAVAGRAPGRTTA